MKSTRRHFLTRAAGVAGAAAVVGATGINIGRAQPKKLRIGVGPLLPTPEDTKKAYTPVFTYLAKQLGMESLAKLRDAVKERIAREHAGASRNRLKRQLLDALDERHKFDLPPTLVSQEFDNVWQTVENDLKEQGRTFADEGTTEEEARGEYRKIAERRVRLGLVIAEIGDKNQIKVTDEEVQRAVVDRARQFPGQEQQVWEFYRNNPQAVASLRAPIYEEKVVDFLTELANVTEKKVAREELYKEDEGDKPAEKAG
jgi:trigger factor